MKVTKKIEVTRNVTKCSDCPWFEDHPHEPSCGLKRTLGARSYDAMCSRREIDKNCPLRNKYNESIY